MKKVLAAATLLSAFGLGFGASPAFAYQGTGTTESSARKTDTPADRFGFFEGEQLQVSTGTDDDNLTFRIALPSSPALADRFSLSLSTPLHGNDDAMPASLDALANGTRATLRWGHFDVPQFEEDEIARGIARTAKDTCRTEEPAETRNRCVDSGYAVRHHARSSYPRYLRHSLHSVTDYGLEATVGINDFEWVDPLTLVPQTARRTDWSVAAQGALYLPGTLTALTGSLSYQRAYEAADEQLLCPPNPVDPATQCITARGAAPTRNENFLLSVGLRHRFMRAGIPLNLAIAPLITYDVLDDIWGVDVPVYFLPDSNGKLTGGIRFGYRSDRENEFTVGVFVGAAFNMLGGGP